MTEEAKFLDDEVLVDQIIEQTAAALGIPFHTNSMDKFLTLLNPELSRVRDLRAEILRRLREEKTTSSFLAGQTGQVPE